MAEPTAARRSGARPVVWDRRAWMLRKLPLYLFLAPTFVFLVAFSYYPAISAVLTSFTSWDGFNPPTFVGLDNYARMLGDEQIQIGARNLLVLTVAHLAIGLTVPLAAAELIFHLKSQRIQYWYRVLFVIPMVVPGVTILMIWRFAYDPQVGLWNQLFRTVGLGLLANDWLGSFTMALPSLIILNFPWIAGLNFLIYLAGLQGIPAEVIDAASVDGATGWTRIRAVDLPLVMAQVKLLLILGIIGQVQQFVNVLILTNGGPGDSTMVPGLVMYQRAFSYGEFGYGTAIGTTIFVVVLVLTYVNLKYVRSSTEYEPTR